MSYFAISTFSTTNTTTLFIGQYIKNRVTEVAKLYPIVTSKNAKSIYDNR